MKVLIVEDNPNAAQIIETVLTTNMPDIEICGQAETVDEARDLISLHAPQIWMLDIRLKDAQVFELFDQLEASQFTNTAIIFITAYNRPEYLLKAIKISAFDFIFKPIDEEELVSAVKRAKEKIESQDLAIRLKKLEQKIGELEKNKETDKLPIYRVNGLIDYMDTVDILYLEAEHSICRFYFADDNIVTSVKNLGFYKEGLVQKSDFLPISKKHVVNPTHVQSYDPINGKVLLLDGTRLSVSRRKGKKLREYFKQLL